MRRQPRTLLFLSTLFLSTILTLLLLPIAASRAQSESSKGYAHPKLILILVIDQFRYDYLVRFRPYFVERGFNLLLSGANFVNCRYDYASTATCPGHASLFTGAYPNIHGIIANEWYDPARYRRVYCVEDPDTTLVGGEPGPGFSPRKLMADTLGDELRMATDFQSKVVAISLKDRASVVPGGHTANAAYWWDVDSGHFVTSTYYMSALPAWASQFNQAQPAKRYCGQRWQALPEIPSAGGKVLKEFPGDPNEPCPDGKFIGWLHNTPFMNEIELNFALEAVRNERLGQGSSTDLLAVSLSVNDYIGHSFGPYSPEVADTTVRTDRYLADFLSQLDRVVGLDNVWIALSADHGVAPNPKFIRQHRLGVGRLSSLDLESAVEKALSQKFGKGQWVQDATEFYLSLNASTLKQFHVDRAAAEAVAAEAAMSVPGVRAAYGRSQLMESSVANNPLTRKAFNSFNPLRSGDVFLVWDTFAVPVDGDIATTHGSPWSYDSQVPLILLGSAFQPGYYSVPVEPIDLAPTLAAALGLTQPSGAQGHPLTMALK